MRKLKEKDQNEEEFQQEKLNLKQKAKRNAENNECVFSSIL